MSIRVEGPDRTGSAPAGRIVALDGLRGLAALVVLVHHSLLTWPALADQYNAPNRASGTWWLTFTPLHLVWAGTEAVIVFFLLSGIVLVRPHLARPPAAGTWRGYYPRRLIRLYAPVLVAVCLAGVLVRRFPRVPAPGVSWWFAAHAVQATPRTLAHDALLLDGAGPVNTVLWSLRYEVTFSLLLPFVVLLVRRWPRTLWLNLPLSLGLVALGQLGTNPFGLWIPYFLVGAAVAAGWEELCLLGQRVQDSALRGPVWGFLCVVTGIVLLSNWWFRWASLVSPSANAVSMSLVALGAVLLCFLAVSCPTVRRVLSSRFLQWAGRISFSLYLVHEPIVVSVSSLAGPGKKGVATTLVVGGLIAIGVATAFHRWVEQPAQRWARAAGRRLATTAVQVPPPDLRPPVPRHTAARRPVLPSVPPPRGPRLPETSRRAPVPFESGR